MSNQDYNWWINFWSIFAGIGLILAAIGVIYFRHYSAKQSRQTAIEIQNKIEEGSGKTLNRINESADSLITKVEMATDTIIIDLKQKSNDALRAIDVLEENIKMASFEIQEGVDSIQGHTSKIVKNLDYRTLVLHIPFKLPYKTPDEVEEFFNQKNGKRRVAKYLTEIYSYNLIVGYGKTHLNYQLSEDTFKIINYYNNKTMRNTIIQHNMDGDFFSINFEFKLDGNLTFDRDSFEKDGFMSLILRNKGGGRSTTIVDEYIGEKIMLKNCRFSFLNDDEWTTVELINRWPQVGGRNDFSGAIFRFSISKQ